MSRIGMTSISRSFKGFFEIKLRRDFSANAVAHNETGDGDIPQNDIVFPRHLNQNPRISRREIENADSESEIQKKNELYPSWIIQ